MNSVSIRSAAATDAAFLVECIIGAEKSGTDKLSYSTIFQIPEAQVREALLQILDEDIEGQELCVSGFRIAEVNGAPAAAICAWIEGNGGKSSSLLKANLLMHFFGRDRMFAAEANLKLMEELAMPRQRGALQLESIYVLPSFRGRRLAAQIIEHHLRGARQAGPAVSIAQIILAGTNTDAISSYRRAGFEIIRQRTSNDPRILTLLPAGTKLLMQRLL